MSTSEPSPLSTAPDSEGAEHDAVGQYIDEAVAALRGKNIAVLTGAGVSTDSGIPDYRGAGAPVRSPMTFQMFLADEQNRKRYWAGGQLGWKRFSAAQPNLGHRALADMERLGFVTGLITQNVDGLHLRAGSERVVDLHGAMDRVFCLDCGQFYARQSVADQIVTANPWMENAETLELSPDGDVDVHAVENFVVPTCSVCGGTLKPDVVFFGEFIPKERFEEASALVRSAEALLIAGSSLVVNSGIRLLDQAVRRRMSVVIINRGVTKGDSRASVKVDAGTSDTIATLLERLRS